MGDFSLTSSGSGLDGARARLQKLQSQQLFASLDKFGREGVAALSAATPVDTHLTASSWTYEIINEKGVRGIRWLNTNIVAGQPLAILLQYGHGTGTGGYVQGRDYINPVIKPLFERIKADVRKAVSAG